MTGKLMGMSDKEIEVRIGELERVLFDENGKLKNVSKVSYLAPILQMYAAELSTRFAKRTTIAVLCVSVLSLAVSAIALYISYQSVSAL